MTHQITSHKKQFFLTLTSISLLLLTACGAETNNETTAAVETTSPTIADAENYPGDWLAHGRTWSEQRFSPLEKINTVFWWQQMWQPVD